MHQKFLITILVVSCILFFSIKADAVPVGPDTLNITANETKSSSLPQQLNLSGGRLATISINATSQNPRWKGFVGWVTGSFTLADSTNSRIYDWSSTSSSGLVYATRNATTISWPSINCSNSTTLNAENLALNLTNQNDNLTKTFNMTGNHSAFIAASISFPANYCPSLHTYIGNATQYSKFQEMAMYDGASVFYATVLENDEPGFDSNSYDFQMIVPDRGDPGWSSYTPYYMYVELT